MGGGNFVVVVMVVWERSKVMCMVKLVAKS